MLAKVVMVRDVGDWTPAVRKFDSALLIRMFFCQDDSLLGCVVDDVPEEVKS